MHARNTFVVDPSTTFLLIHGAGTSSSMWGPLQRELAVAGYRSFAVDLPGHGPGAQFPIAYQAPQDLAALAEEPSTLATTGIDDNVDVVVDAAERLAATGPVVLVGSSLGGATLGAAASRAPHLVAGMVYISAWVCATRVSPIAWMGEPEFATSLLPLLGGISLADPAVIGAGRANYRTGDPEQLALLKEATMAEATDDEFRAFLSLMQPDESLAVMAGDAGVDLAAWGAIPRAFIRLTLDRSIPIELQDRMIADADRVAPDRPFLTRTLAASHAGFLRHPVAVSAMLTGY